MKKWLIAASIAVPMMSAGTAHASGWQWTVPVVNSTDVVNGFLMPSGGTVLTANTASADALGNIFVGGVCAYETATTVEGTYTGYGDDMNTEVFNASGAGYVYLPAVGGGQDGSTTSVIPDGQGGCYAAGYVSQLGTTMPPYTSTYYDSAQIVHYTTPTTGFLNPVPPTGQAAPGGYQPPWLPLPDPLQWDQAPNLTAAYNPGTYGNNKDNIEGSTTDAAGNVYVVGSDMNSAGQTYLLLIKYNSSMVRQWVVSSVSTPILGSGYRVAVDSSDNVYVGGVNALWKFTQSGSTVTEVTTGGWPYVISGTVTSMVLDLGYVVAIGDTEIYSIPQTGGTEHSATVAGQSAIGIAVDSIGGVYALSGTHIYGGTGASSLNIQRYSPAALYAFGGPHTYSPPSGDVGFGYKSISENAQYMAVCGHSLFVAALAIPGGTQPDQIVVLSYDLGTYDLGFTMRPGYPYTIPLMANSSLDYPSYVTTDNSSHVYVTGLSADGGGTGNLSLFE